MLSKQLLDFLPSHILQTIHTHFFACSCIFVCMLFNTVFYVINVALPLTHYIGYNYAIKYSSSSSCHSDGC